MTARIGIGVIVAGVILGFFAMILAAAVAARHSGDETLRACYAQIVGTPSQRAAQIQACNKP